MLQAKLHRVRVTGSDLHYEDSCGIDELLLVGDLLIIAAYSAYTEAELIGYRPAIVLVDEQNRARSWVR